MEPKAAVSLFKVEVQRRENTAVVKCTGRLVVGLTDELYNPVKALLPDYKRVVLDFTELARMDSSGLGTLVRLYVSAKSAGCALQLLNVGPPIRKLLGITNLLDAFTIVAENNIKFG